MKGSVRVCVEIGLMAVQLVIGGDLLIGCYPKKKEARGERYDMKMEVEKHGMRDGQVRVIC